MKIPYNQAAATTGNVTSSGAPLNSNQPREGHTGENSNMYVKYPYDQNY